MKKLKVKYRDFFVALRAAIHTFLVPLLLENANKAALQAQN